jgi:hypothetical protein
MEQLAAEDQDYLIAYESKLVRVRAGVEQVALGYESGMHLWGAGGVGKSFTVLKELDRLEVDYKLSNSRLTGRGLFDLLRESPSSIHVIEDAEQMTGDRNAVGVLRSALGGQPKGKRRRPERLVTWLAHQTKLHFYFSGGIILTANRPLDDTPELAALRTRLLPLQLLPSNPELAALMRSLAFQEYRRGDLTLPPEVCREVCEFVIRSSLSFAPNLNLRLFNSALADYLYWQQEAPPIHWHDLVSGRLQQRVLAFKSLESDAEEERREQEVAADLYRQKLSRAERERLWRERTGRSIRTYQRRINDLKKLGKLAQEAPAQAG